MYSSSVSFLNFFFWLHGVACEILVPQPVPAALEAQSPNHWAAREFIFFLKIYLFLAAVGLGCCAQAFSSWWVQASLCGGFSR